MMIENHGAPPSEAGRFFIFIYVGLIWLGPHLDRAPSGSVGEAGQSIGLSCAHGPGPLSSPLVPVLSSYPCSRFTSAAGGLGGVSRAGLKGRPPNGPVQTARPLRCGSLSDRPADETASTGPDGPSVSERVRAGPNDDVASTDADVSSPAGGPSGARRPLLVLALSLRDDLLRRRYRMDVSTGARSGTACPSALRGRGKGGGRRRALPALCDSADRRSGCP
jgi:hypothetical protein